MSIERATLLVESVVSSVSDCLLSNSSQLVAKPFVTKDTGVTFTSTKGSIHPHEALVRDGNPQLVVDSSFVVIVGEKRPILRPIRTDGLFNPTVCAIYSYDPDVVTPIFGPYDDFSFESLELFKIVPYEFCSPIGIDVPKYSKAFSSTFGRTVARNRSSAPCEAAKTDICVFARFFNASSLKPVPLLLGFTSLILIRIPSNFGQLRRQKKSTANFS